MTLRILTASLRYENDVVAARQRARQVSELLGFEGQDQTRIATAVSEIARNALVYGGGGRLEFAIEGTTAPQVLLTTISDQGRGIGNLEEVLAGHYNSQTGMGLGILGARRLMDGFQIESAPGTGTRVALRKLLPPGAPLITPAALGKLADALAGEVDGKPRTLLQELQQQNRELVRALEELRVRQEELSVLNAELADTNRGVIALYAELDEKADHLRRADELKSRFLSNMSHEFRTPLNSILALTRLLLDRTDGALSAEQERQVGYIRRAAESLYDLVNDLLDLAKVEAGKIEVHPTEFRVEDIFGALRGMLRPLLVTPHVTLAFEEPGDLPVMRTDDGKLSQILRNFISNALKFTTEGEIRVSARFVPAGERAAVPHSMLGDDLDAMPAATDSILFSVEDTGLGIAPAHHDRIFHEFGQLDNPIQRRVRGTGLGLPLSKRLTELLGGTLRLRSEEGRGSTFAALIPREYAGAHEAPAPTPAGRAETKPVVLVVEDAPEDRLIYERILADSEMRPVFAGTAARAREIAREVRPAAIILDIMLRGQASWSLLADFKSDAATSRIPVIVASTLDDRQKGYGLGADAYFVKPVDGPWLRQTLSELGREGAGNIGGPILLIDDDETHRYILRGFLECSGRAILEAADGERGLEMAAHHKPAIVLLDLGLPGLSGDDLLQRLRTDPGTAITPVVIVTSESLSADRRAALSRLAAGILNKDHLARNEVLLAVSRALSTDASAPVADPHRSAVSTTPSIAGRPYEGRPPDGGPELSGYNPGSARVKDGPFL